MLERLQKTSKFQQNQWWPADLIFRLLNVCMIHIDIINIDYV